MAELTQQRAREAFHYDTETGELTRPNGRRAGGIQKSTGYHRVTLDGVCYRTHRFIWFWVHGVWPSAVIDHIDGNPANNRIENLRDVSMAVNIQNQKRAHKNSKVGLLGVHIHKGRFRAAIWSGGRMNHLGQFPSATAAHAAYLQAKSACHGE